MATKAKPDASATPGKKPKVPRTADLDFERRIEAMRKRIAEGCRSAEALEFAVKTWGVGTSTAYGYYNKAVGELRAARQLDAEAEMARAIQLREMLFQECLENDDRATALATLRDMSRLHGLYPTDRAALARAGLDTAAAKAIDSGASPLVTMLRDAIAGRVPKPDAEVPDGGVAEG